MGQTNFALETNTLPVGGLSNRIKWELPADKWFLWTAPLGAWKAFRREGHQLKADKNPLLCRV